MTMKQVATLAGVSTATVSRVLNGNPTTRPEVAARVRAAMAELNYRPNRVARSLRRTETDTIAVLVSNVANPFFAELVRSIEDAALESGLSLILGNASEMAARQDLYLRSFLEQQIGGLIITPTGTDTAWLDEYAARRVPVVFVDRTVPGNSAPSATTDHGPGLDQLVRHLVSLGHRTASLITGVPTNSPTRLRVAGFLEAAQRHGLTVDPSHVRVGGTTVDGGRDQARDLLRQGTTDVIFTTNNVMALGALQATSEAGVRIPDEIALASYDDTPWFEVMTPPITAIAQPVSELGRVSLDLLTGLMRGEEVKSVQLPSTFVPRRSCGELI